MINQMNQNENTQNQFSNAILAKRENLNGRNQMDPKLVITKKELGKPIKVYWETGNMPIEGEGAMEILQNAKEKVPWKIDFSSHMDVELVENMLNHNRHKWSMEMDLQRPKRYPKRYPEPYRKLVF